MAYSIHEALYPCAFVPQQFEWKVTKNFVLTI